MKGTIFLSLVLNLVSITSFSAAASLLIDVKAAPGPDVSADGKLILPSYVGKEFTMQVWGTAHGDNSRADDDGLAIVTGGVLLTGEGELALDTTTHPFGYVAPFDTDINQPMVSNKQLGLGGSTSGSGPLRWRSGNIQIDTELDQSYLLGTFKFSSGNGPCTINYLKPGVSIGSLFFKVDEMYKHGMPSSGWNMTYAGSPVQCVPEPSTVFLLAVGGFGLAGFALRNKKR